MNDPALFILSNTFSSIVTLRLRVRMVPDDDLANLVHIASAFSHLQTLDILAYTSLNFPRTTSLNLSTHLRHLVLNCGRGTTGLLEWFISHPDRPALRSICLDNVYAADFDTIVKVISLLENTLESISFFSYYYGGTLSVFLVGNLIDLGCMGLEMHCQIDLGHIRSLQIRPKEAHRRLIRWLARVLSRISSIHMDEIVLELHPMFNGSPSSLTWQAIDTVLQQPTFSRLRKFEIHFLTSTALSRILAEEQSQLFIHNLPQCNARGILCIRQSHVPI